MDRSGRTTPGRTVPARRTAYEVLAGASRALVLEQVRGHRDGVDTATLAGVTGLHPNTVRFHLNVLAGAGLVTARSAPGGKPGRPRMLFAPARVPPPASPRPAPPSPSDVDGYALLAGILLEHLATLDTSPGTSAEAAGRSWLPDRTAAATVGQRTDPEVSDDDAVSDVTALLADLGFAPETVRDRDGWRILLHRCPFSTLAAEQPQVVCRLHLGLLQGAIDRLGRVGDRVRLQPFVASGLCEAFLPLAALQHRVSG